MYLRPKAFCTNCYEKVPYYIDFGKDHVTIRDVAFSYYKTRAICEVCNREVYVPAINDKNWYERHKAYYLKLDELKEMAQNGDQRPGSAV